jgi:hypothetical protein
MEGRADILSDRLQVTRAGRALVERLGCRRRLVGERRGRRDERDAHALARQGAQREHCLHRAEPAAHYQHVRGVG